MIICFPSMAPMQCGKFHLLPNSVARSNHSFLKVGVLMNLFLLFIHLLICLFIYLLIYLFIIYLFIYLFIKTLFTVGTQK